MKKHIASLVLVLLFNALAIPLVAHAQDEVIHVQTPKDGWQVRRAQTHTLINTLSNPNASQAEKADAMHDFDARLTAAEKGELTPIETMELLRVFYVPQELHNSPPHFDTLLRTIAAQATLGRYDALRFADASGRAEISVNESFFTMPFGDNARDFIQFVKDQPELANAAIEQGIQDARNKIKTNSIGPHPTACCVCNAC
jgi:hypothetical protein